MSKLNELVAIHVMDYTREKMQAKKRIELQIFLDRHPGVKNVKQSGYEWPPDYASDICITFDRFNTIDMRMKELGRFDEYVQAILGIVSPECAQTDILLVLMNVTKKQRCIAALKAMGIDYEDDGIFASYNV